MKILTIFTFGINLFLFIFIPQDLPAQNQGRVEGELIGQTNDYPLQEIMAELHSSVASQPAKLTTDKFGASSSFFLLHLQSNPPSAKPILAKLSKLPKL